jgi:hypothetical protein
MKNKLETNAILSGIISDISESFDDRKPYISAIFGSSKRGKGKVVVIYNDGTSEKITIKLGERKRYRPSKEEYAAKD